MRNTTLIVCIPLSVLLLAGSAQADDLAGSDTLFSITTQLLEWYPGECGGECYCDPNCPAGTFPSCACDATVGVCDMQAVNQPPWPSFQVPCGCDTDCYPSQIQCLCDTSSACDQGDPLAYIGGGSSAGYNAMLAGTQEIAPMSSQKSANCGLYPGTEYLGHSLDAVSVVRAEANLDPSSPCESVATGAMTITVQDLDGNPGVQCPGCGVGTSQYTFKDHRDVLSVLYGGKDQISGTVDCNSDLRRTLAGLGFNNVGREAIPVNGTNDAWESLFEIAGSQCGDEVCGMPWHIWRRGDLSGTTDTFIGFANISNSGISWCGDLKCSDGTACTSNGDCAGIGDQTCRGRSPCNFCNGDQYMDKDPIRRPCWTGSGGLREDVCQADGTAGLLLPVVLPPEYVRNEDPTTGDARECRPGKFFWKKAPFATRPLCEDGSTPALGRCLIPHTGYCDDNATACGTDAACSGIGSGICVYRAGCINGPANGSVKTPGGTDTRVFNRVVRDALPQVNYQTGGQMVIDEEGKDTSNAWYRIHEAHLSNTYSQTCQEPSSTRQIGCLVQASGCSLGYAGMEADTIPATYGLKINNVEATVQNIRNWMDKTAPYYPFTRYLWVGTLLGFPNITVFEEDKLQACFHDRDKIDKSAMAAGFVPLDANPGGGYVKVDDKCP